MRRFRHRFMLWMRQRRAAVRTRQPWAKRLTLIRRRGEQPHRMPLLGVILIAAGVLIVGNYYINNHLRPIMTQMARVQVDQLASRVINKAIADHITGDGVTYSTLVNFEKDTNGQITALKTDIVSINNLRAGITEEVLSSLQQADTSKLSIPVGNLINSDIFGGRGPRIPLKIVPLGTVSSNFSNQFSAAGINQTRHQIMLDITVDITILLPGYRVGTQVTVQVCVAETVIVGAVPDSYFQMDDIFRRE